MSHAIGMMSFNGILGEIETYFFSKVDKWQMISVF
jgi:hypothetical protein